MPYWPHCLTALFAFLAGSFPTGFLMGKLNGIDIRNHGSGNIGATNVFRVLGKGPGIAVFIVDALKGWIGAAWFPGFVQDQFFPGIKSPFPEWLPIVGGLAAILGHNFTPWLGFKGGKGIATSAGVLGGLTPIGLGTVVATWLLVFAVSSYVSLASIVAAISLPIGVYFFRGGTLMTGVALAMSLLAIWKHRSNIHRLLKGTENRFGKARTDTANPK